MWSARRISSWPRRRRQALVLRLGPRGLGKSSLCGARRARCEMRARSSRRSICARSPSKRRTRLAVSRHRRTHCRRLSSVSTWGVVGCKRPESACRVFLEIVLTNTTAPIVVLVDELDAALDLELAAEFLDAVGGCYARRAREPDFARLGFALAGCTSRRALAAASAGSVLADAELIEPEDFSVEQAYRLAVAFGGEQELAQALMDRVWAWTEVTPI